MSDKSGPAAGISVVIPAHNEARTIARLLIGLTAGAAPGELELVVVCNGCADSTAEVARGAAPDAVVIEIPEPSKQNAVRAGDQSASRFPRLYVDADVEIALADVRALAAALDGGRWLAVAPERRVPRDGTSLVVRWYYDVWERLPQVRSGLFGRGVLGVSSAGHLRTSALPAMMSDDLAMSEAFDATERTVIRDARVVVHPPRTTRDLVRRRIRVATGNAQMDHQNQRSASARTSVSDVVRLSLFEPRMVLRVPVFVAVTMVGRFGARRRVAAGDYSSWLRDESSRQD